MTGLALASNNAPLCPQTSQAATDKTEALKQQTHQALMRLQKEGKTNALKIIKRESIGSLHFVLSPKFDTLHISKIFRENAAGKGIIKALTYIILTHIDHLQAEVISFQGSFYSQGVIGKEYVKPLAKSIAVSQGVSEQEDEVKEIEATILSKGMPAITGEHLFSLIKEIVDNNS